MICLNMIVKNESAVIRQCLASVLPLIDYWVIVDTGSLDGTQEIVKETLKGVPGELYERDWVDFSHNRNAAMSLSKGKGDYLLFIDADEKLIYPSDFAWPSLQSDCYVAIVRYSQKENVEFGRVLLINNHLDWEWKGVVHEEIQGSLGQSRSGSMLQDVSILTDLGGKRSQDPKKTLKDAQLLEKVVKNDPQNSRALFYLALSYDVAQEPHLALKNYLQRSLLKGDDGEIFYSLYRAARLQESIGLSSETIVESYQKAHRFCPSRAEPLYYLAKYYLKNRNYQESSKLLKMALAISQPRDHVFVEPSIYQYETLWLVAECMFQMRRYSETIDAFTKLLSIENLPPEYRKQLEVHLPMIRNKLFNSS